MYLNLPTRGISISSLGIRICWRMVVWFIILIAVNASNMFISAPKRLFEHTENALTWGTFHFRWGFMIKSHNFWSALAWCLWTPYVLTPSPKNILLRITYFLLHLLQHQPICNWQNIYWNMFYYRCNIKCTTYNL